MSRTNDVNIAMQYAKSGVDGVHLMDSHKATIGWVVNTLAAEVERLEKRENELINALDMGQINCDAVYDELREEREDAKQRAEAAEALAERLKGHLLAHDAERTLYLRRLLWLHDCGTGTTDPDGYEWGIYRVKWVNGQAVEVWQTNSDFSDLDAAIERDEYRLPASAKVLEARVKELEADANRLMQRRDEYSGRIHSMQSKIAEAGFPMRQKWGEDLDGNEDWVTIRAEVQLDGLLKAFAREREQNARLRAALERLDALYISEFDHEDRPPRPQWLKAALNGEEASK